MERIPVPTIDDITGHTVMVKMRNLIKNYVATIAQVIERVEDTVTREEIIPYLKEFLADYYTKEQIDEIIENIDLTNYYNKTQTDALLNAKANVADVYTKSQTDALVSPKADANNVYTKSQTDALLSPKADISNVYTKSQTDTLLSSKADISNVYTKSQTDALLSPKANASEVYTKTETDTKLAQKQNVLTPGVGISIVNDEISATGNYPHWELVPADEWATYLESDATYAAKEDVKIVYYLNDGYVRGEYEVLAGTRYIQSAGLLYTVGTQNNMLRIQTWSIGNFPGEINPVTSTTVRYRIYTYLSDGTSSNEMRTASKTPSATSSNYIALYHKVQ